MPSIQLTEGTTVSSSVHAAERNSACPVFVRALGLLMHIAAGEIVILDSHDRCPVELQEGVLGCGATFNLTVRHHHPKTFISGWSHVYKGDYSKGSFEFEWRGEGDYSRLVSAQGVNFSESIVLRRV